MGLNGVTFNANLRVQDDEQNTPKAASSKCDNLQDLRHLLRHAAGRRRCVCRQLCHLTDEGSQSEGSGNFGYHSCTEHHSHHHPKVSHKNLMQHPPTSHCPVLHYSNAGSRSAELVALPALQLWLAKARSLLAALPPHQT